MKREKLNILYCALRDAIAENKKNHQEKYPTKHDIESVVNIVCSSIWGNGIKSVSIETDSWKIACKKLGIKNTYKAIEDFLKN